MFTDETSDAPEKLLPWLAATEKTGDSRQAWTPEIPERVYFTVRFQTSPEDHKRCDNRVIRMYPHMLTVVALFIVVTNLLNDGGFYLYRSCKAGHWLPLTWNMLLQPLQTATMIVIALLIFRWLSYRERVKKMAKENALECLLTVASAYLECEMLGNKVRLTYKQIENVVYNHGDIYVVGLLKHFYIPRSAFADAESQEMLYDAIYSLWKGSGSVNALVPEVRTRFLNTTDDTVTPGTEPEPAPARKPDDEHAKPA